MVDIVAMLQGVNGAPDEGRIRYYMEALDDSPPVIVYDDGSEMTLAAGHHRVEAARRLGRRTIWAEVRRGSRHDATRYPDYR